MKILKPTANNLVMVIAGACAVLSGLAGMLLTVGGNWQNPTFPTADQLSMTALICIILALAAVVRSLLDN